MQQEILAKLESSRKELLDLGMRNTLLNYKMTTAKGLHIVHEKSSAVFDLLVRKNRAMTFLPRVGNDGDDGLPELTEPELTEVHNDTRLQTDEVEQKLQTRLLNTFYFARTSIEEQGVNILYLALGMLKWYEKGNVTDPRLAPLILVPVNLERSSASERFRLRYSGSDIGSNLSLQAKMSAEFSISIPDLDDQEEMDVDAYFGMVKQCIAGQPSWDVLEDNMVLGFFSFGKFLIYHDLDAAGWPEDRKPYDHEVIKALFADGFRQPPPTVGSDVHLDNERLAHDLSPVVDADSSQLIAMMAVKEGRHLVIQGPPGTGKSQTIANLIADAIGAGKKVLFVAEKMAALEVVKRRLDNIHLGVACLELHSHKSNKRALHEELKKVLDLGKPAVEKLEHEIQMLAPLIEELNGYCNAINRGVLKSGLSAQEIIGNLLRIARHYGDYKFPKIGSEESLDWDIARLLEAEALADQVQARLQTIGEPRHLLFYGTAKNLLLPAEEAALKELLEQVENTDGQFGLLKQEVAQFLLLDNPEDRSDLARCFELLDLARQSPSLSGFSIDAREWADNKDDIIEVVEAGKRLTGLHEKYANDIIPEAWNFDVLPIRMGLVSHGTKWYRFAIGEYKRSVRQLAGLLSSPVPKELEKKLEYVNAILEAKRLTEKLDEYRPLLNRLLDHDHSIKTVRWEHFGQAADYLCPLHLGIRTGAKPISFLAVLRYPGLTETALRFHTGLSEINKLREEQLQQLIDRLGFSGEFLVSNYAEQSGIIKRWKERLPELHRAIQWNVLKETMVSKGAGYLIDAVLEWPDAHSHLKVALQKNWYERLLESALVHSPELRRFERSSHEEILARFRRLDVLKQHYNRVIIALKHYENLPKLDGGGQINVLRNEFNRKARHMPIRKLMKEAGIAIQAIKPVIMMSPMSIANFLPPDSIAFDLVIFDEASQVRPVEALGAILRGKQMVVVGDTKQMPPTSFFDKLNLDIEEDDNVTADMQSILGMCDAQGAPQTMLRWHYRSRHESLISLSNQEFYENKLVIFPSPGSKHRMGLCFHHLPHTYYDKGKTRTNEKEAERVADAVIEHARKHSKQSLGVVAFSTPQMQAINAAMEVRRRLNPEVEDFFRMHTDEPFFVKNLENVQGDERDVIFISIGYGRTEAGSLSMNFGPLNNEGGERRLNVLITRAKTRCEVFTNVTADDIVVGPATKFGIRALKNFLRFAQHGKFESDSLPTGAVSTPFEEVVSMSLKERGYVVRERVGSAGYHIDLAVVDQKHPGRYILGILCDGKSYASAKSATDRDRLRKEVLEGMGWKLYQIWSIDWYRNPAAELQSLIAHIEKLRLQVEEDDMVEQELEQELQELVREARSEDDTQKPSFYEVAVLPGDIARSDLYEQSAGNLGRWVTEVVAKESPVHQDEVIRRLAEAYGVSKIGSRVRAVVSDAIRYAEQVGMIERRGDFLWLPGHREVVVRDRSNLSASSRKVSYIAPEELHHALAQVVREAVAIQPLAATVLVAKLFGFGRLTEDIRAHLLAGIQTAVAAGYVTQDGEFLRESKYVQER